jgi:nucleotide-binding universal stress UspA family protein
MLNQGPVFVALPLDHETPDIVVAATELAKRLAAPLVVMHAIRRRRLESEKSVEARVTLARSRLESHLAPLRASGLEIQDVMVEIGHPAEVVIEAAPVVGAQMIVTGGGRPATVRRWVVGSVAEAIVRRSSVPVWVARGKPPLDRPLLCPVDLSPESKVGLEAAIRMAGLFQTPLSLISVVKDESATRFDRSGPQLQQDEAAARLQVETMLGEFDTDGLDVTVQVTTGDAAQRIVEAADQAGLLVIASRGYDPLVRDWLGPVTERALRHSLCSALMIRHVGEGHEEREVAIARLADAYHRAQELLDDDRGPEALPLIEHVAEQATANAAVQETYAIALERVGRKVEATSRRELAALIRERLG